MTFPLRVVSPSTSALMVTQINWTLPDSFSTSSRPSVLLAHICPVKVRFLTVAGDSGTYQYSKILWSWATSSLELSVILWIVLAEHSSLAFLLQSVIKLHVALLRHGASKRASPHIFYLLWSTESSNWWLAFSQLPLPDLGSVLLFQIEGKIT